MTKFTNIVLIFITYVSLLVWNHNALMCDNYSNYAFGGVTVDRPDAITLGCNICGYFSSNQTDNSYIIGTMMTCLENIESIAAPNMFPRINVTEFDIECKKEASFSVPYCLGSSWISNGVWFQTQICCCATPLCTRKYMDGSIPLINNQNNRHSIFNKIYKKD